VRTGNPRPGVAAREMAVDFAIPFVVTTILIVGEQLDRS
jgi:hypothetical protein